MRKVFWCCLAAGATVCCAFWAAAYVSQNPDSSLGRAALIASSRVTGEPASPGVHASNIASVDTDELIPADPVPVDAVPPLPTPGTQIPPEIAGLLTPPPIVIHDEEPHGLFAALTGKTKAKTVSSTVEVAGASVENGSVSESLKPRGPLVMPYCKDNTDAPTMPYCADDTAVPVMPPAPPEDVEKVGGAARPPLDALAFWMGFFSGPGQLSCEWTTTANKDALPGAEESSEPPAVQGDKAVNPLDLFSHSRHLQMPRPAEPESDTMEMRPSDWKPYSLDPGPF